jgi:hypothetical protein
MSEVGEGNPDSGSLLRLLKNHVVAVDASIPSIGMPRAINEAFQSSRINILPSYSEGSEEALSTNPVLIVATHPHLLNDTFGIVGAIPKDRHDVSVTSHAMHMGLGKNITSHIIPIYGVDQQVTNNMRERLRRSLLASKTQQLPQLDSARKNLESIGIAASRLDEGGIVVIFPEGSGEEGAEWLSGIGEIVKKIENPETKVVYATTDGNEWRNRARVYSSKARRLLGSTDLHVRFSQPHPISEFKDIESRKEVTQILRAQYDEFNQRIKS